MTIHSNTNAHDDGVWGPDGLGRAADAPVVPGGQPNPFVGGFEASPLAPNVAEIQQFLCEHIGSSIHLVSIDPDGGDAAASGKYFGSDADAATQWAVAENKSGKGLYFTTNITTAGLNKKPTKKEIVAARFSHSDIDPHKGGGVLDRSAIMCRLMQGPLPSFIIDSGNGLQPLWRLDQAPTDYGLVEDINRSIADSFGGDNCHNIDRLLRVPGTINYPNARKRAAGRVATMATLAHIGSGDAIYGLAELAQAFPPRRAEKAKEVSREEFKGDIKLLTPDDLGLSQLNPLRSAIEHPAGRDRSADGLRAAGDMLRAGFTREQVFGVLLNPANKVSAHYLDQADPRRAALRTITYVGRDKPNPPESGTQVGSRNNGSAAPLRYELLHDMPDPLTPLAWVIKGIFAKGETSMWYGPPGGLKSALLADATVAIANGEDWFGRKSKGKFGVIYFALERADLVRRRLQATIARRGITDPLAIAVVPGIRGLNTETDVAQILATINGLSKVFREMGADGVGVTVFDTWAKLVAAGGGDENSAKDVGPIFANLQRIKDETGVHAALIGHTGKDKDRGVRGSSAIPGDIDIGIAIDGDAIKTATVQKANAVPEGKLFSFGSRLHIFGEDEDGDPIDVNVIKPVGAISEATSRKKLWPHNLSKLRNALNEMTINSGVEYRIPQGPTVRSIKVADVRKQYTAAYAHDGTGNRQKMADQSWRRHFERAVANDLIGYRNDGQDDWMWDAT